MDLTNITGKYVMTVQGGNSFTGNWTMKGFPGLIITTIPGMHIQVRHRNWQILVDYLRYPSDTCLLRYFMNKSAKYMALHPTNPNSIGSPLFQVVI